jgi:hypothetical protein
VHHIDDKIKALFNRSLERDYPQVKSWTELLCAVGTASRWRSPTDMGA